MKSESFIDESEMERMRKAEIEHPATEHTAGPLGSKNLPMGSGRPPPQAGTGRSGDGKSSRTSICENRAGQALQPLTLPCQGEGKVGSATSLKDGPRYNTDDD